MLPVRVAFDEQILLLQNQGGVSKYFVELFRDPEQPSLFSADVAAITPVLRSVKNQLEGGLSGEGRRGDDRPSAR